MISGIILKAYRDNVVSGFQWNQNGVTVTLTVGESRINQWVEIAGSRLLVTTKGEKGGSPEQMARQQAFAFAKCLEVGIVYLLQEQSRLFLVPKKMPDELEKLWLRQNKPMSVGRKAIYL